jgi:serine/threonine protein kinase
MLPTHDATRSASDQSERPIPVQIGRYRILGRLGAGGMGTVYKAQDPQLNRTVALKLPRLDGPAQGHALRVQRFQREARAAAGVRHAHVCPIYDVGEHEGQPYVVMAYIEGESLATQLARQGRYQDPRQAADLIRQVLDALEAIHDHGIIHRDLKPSNILLDASGRAVLTDFGLARPTDDSEGLTSEGVVLGTPAYMAPEQASGQSQAAGPWTDLYSLGVILYQMLTGRLPFEGPALKVMAQMLHDPAPLLSNLRPDLDPGLEAIVCKAMAREPQARYQHARQFSGALTAWASMLARSTDPLIRPAQVANIPPWTAALNRLKRGITWLCVSAKRRWRVLVLAVICNVLGILIGLTLHPRQQPELKPLQVGYIQGDLLVRERNEISHEKCDGFKAECYESFVVVYVDSVKQPTWSGNYVLTIPWNKIEHMTLRPASPQP